MISCNLLSKLLDRQIKVRAPVIDVVKKPLNLDMQTQTGYISSRKIIRCGVPENIALPDIFILLFPVLFAVLHDPISLQLMGDQTFGK
jgi:hypothetical protein